MVDRAVPALPSRDLDATTTFFGGFGFEPRFRDAGWLILRRGALQLEFFPAPTTDPFTNGSMCSVRVADLDELWAAIAATGVPIAERGIPRLVPIARQPWGLRAGYLIEPDGSQLALIEDAGEPS